MARTTSSTAKKTTGSSAAKKTATKKTATARPARKTTAAKTPPAKADPTPRLSLVKAEPARPQLPTRHSDFMTDTQGFATLAARLAGITTPTISDWRDHRDGTCTRPLTDGSHLHYTLATRTLTWQAICPMGAVHAYRLDTPSTASAARVHADRCTTPHADLTHIPALTPEELAGYGIHPGPTQVRPDGTPTSTDLVTLATPEPEPEPTPEPRALGDQLTHSGTSTAATQPMNTSEIAAGLAARADHDQMKEHPQP